MLLHTIKSLLRFFGQQVDSYAQNQAHGNHIDLFVLHRYVQMSTEISALIQVEITLV